MRRSSPVATFDKAVVVSLLLHYGIVIDDIAKVVFWDIGVFDGTMVSESRRRISSSASARSHMRRSWPFFADR